MTTLRVGGAVLALALASAAQTAAAAESGAERADLNTGPGVLCDLDGGADDVAGQVAVRAAPRWDAKSTDVQPCGARVQILGRSRKPTMPDRATGRYEDAGGYSAYWYKVQVAASRKTGWVFAGELFRWEESPDSGGSAFRAAQEPEGPTPECGFGRSLYEPSDAPNEEPAYTLHHLVFLAVKGAPWVAVFSAPDGKPFPVLTLDDDTGVHQVAAARLRRDGKGYRVTLEVTSRYQEGGKLTRYAGAWARGEQRVELVQRSSRDL